MRMMTAALVLATMLWAIGSSAEARKVSRNSFVGTPVVAHDPYWVPDYNVVPRYRYRPQDDRVDTGPTARPVASGWPDWAFGTAQ
jgi:hypothetical protein